jgi:hypothetical protein
MEKAVLLLYNRVSDKPKKINRFPTGGWSEKNAGK